MFIRSGFLVVGMVFLLVGLSSAVSPSPPVGWFDGCVLSNGIRIHYWRTGGNKPVLVLAHGFSDDGLCWTNLAKEIASDYDIIMYDARGHGSSDAPSASDPADVQVEDLAGLIKELKLTKPILMGHSMGSSTVAWFAAKYPDIPRGVILEDPGLAARRPGSPGGPATPIEREKRKAEILARNNQSQEQLVTQCRKDSPNWEPSECDYWAASKRSHHPNTALGTAGNRPPMNELFPLITSPTLILKADAQGDVRKENELAASLLKRGRIVHIEGAGHSVRRDQKQRLLEVLKPFLAGL
jgi:pimeloyl-ACP methyl ester carboxylesterase